MLWYGMVFRALYSAPQQPWANRGAPYELHRFRTTCDPSLFDTVWDRKHSPRPSHGSVLRIQLVLFVRLRDCNSERKEQFADVIYCISFLCNQVSRGFACAYIFI